MSYVTLEYVLDSDCIPRCGEEKFGMCWNEVCDLIRDNELYAHDGDGYFYISHSSQGYPYEKPLQQIIDYILDEVDLKEVKVVECN